jgi:hypothetical protein
MCHQHWHPAGESVFTFEPDSEMHAIRHVPVSGLSGLTKIAVAGVTKAPFSRRLNKAS